VGDPGTASAASVDYGPISHKNMKNLGAASNGLKLSLQLGLIANQNGIASAAKSASSPTSSSYGKYPSLSTLQSKYGASSSRRKDVVNAFKQYGITAKVDVTHLRVSATISIKNAHKMFGTKWNLYKASGGQHVALPVNTPKLPSGLNGNVDTVAGMRLTVSQGTTALPCRTSSPSPTASARRACPRRRRRRRSSSVIWRRPPRSGSRPSSPPVTAARRRARTASPPRSSPAPTSRSRRRGQRHRAGCWPSAGRT
jgi:hypothetical protein